MYISKFQIENYKSFFTTPEIDLTPGFNVIVGQNNVGKTALVEALSLRFQHQSHRSMKTIPRPGMPISPDSKVNVAFQTAEDEAEQVLVDTGANFSVPLPSNVPLNQRDVAEFAPKFREMLVRPDTLQCVYQPGNFISAYLEAYDTYANGQHAMQFTVDFSRGQLEPVLDGSYPVAGNDLPSQYGKVLANALRERIYIFRAERLSVSASRFGTETVLKSDASNLAEVLHNLQSSNPIRFRRLNDYLGIIFPEIKYITVPPGPGHEWVQILVWSVDPATEREDLAIPLSESGTGIGQALAILYVVLTASHPQTIIIDEPQSFLHPGAIRKLMEILRQHLQHQFIIITHSPEIVAAVKPRTLLLLRKEQFETTTETLDASEVKDLQIFLLEVGVRLSDVFGADNILWVEGSTEEQCFPLIVEKLLQMPLQGTKIISVLQTGDFEGRHSERTLQIYKRLSMGRGLIPPAIGFIFDREGRSERDQKDLIRQSQGSVVFLHRRMYENYLLNPQAIAFVVSQIEGFRDTPVTPEEVAQWLEDNRSNRAYVTDTECTEDKWLQEAHGAKVLGDIFKDFSELRVYYDKVTHGVALTERILENAPDDLRDVANVIDARMQPERKINGTRRYNVNYNYGIARVHLAGSEMAGCQPRNKEPESGWWEPGVVEVAQEGATINGKDGKPYRVEYCQSQGKGCMRNPD